MIRKNSLVTVTDMTGEFKILDLTYTNTNKLEVTIENIHTKQRFCITRILANFKLIRSELCHTV